MPAAHDAEIRGDWNDLKDAHYHFIYALWSLLCEHDRRVSFYRGNDLHLTLTVPPRPTGMRAGTSIINLRALPPDSDLDIRVQLKATTETWSRASLLSEADNVIVNFLCNALTSRRACRPYAVRLVTQAAVKARELTELIDRLDGPTAANPSLEALNKAIKRVQKRYTVAGEPVPDEAELKALTREILDQLQHTQPISLRLLMAEIERELYRLYPDPQTVRTIKAILLGAMFDEAGRGPDDARPLDWDWVESTGSPPLFNRGILDKNAIEACRGTVRSATPRGWDPALCARRTDLHAILDRFVSAPQAACVVISAPGCGLSWGVYDWAQHYLDQHLCLFLSGDTLTADIHLTTLVGNALRPTTTARWSPDDFLQRLRAAAVDERGPIMLILDGVPAPTSGEQMRVVGALERLVSDCKQTKVKLVLTCHTDVWTKSKLSDGIMPTDLLHRPDMTTAASEHGATFLLNTLSAEEMGDILRRRLGSDVAATIEPQLVTPPFGTLRNPYLLTLYLQQNDETLRTTGQAQLRGIDGLLDDRVTQALGRIARSVERGIDDIRPAFDALVDRLWATRLSTLTNPATMMTLNGPLPGLENTVFTALIREGLLTATGPIALAEPAVAARCFAHALRQHGFAVEALSPDQDGEVVVALLRSAPDPIADAGRFLSSTEQWLEPVVEGLAQYPHDDLRIVALLAVLARPDPGASRFLQPHACWALGERASRDERAFRWVRDMYLGEREAERYRGGEALAATLNLAPTRVGETVRDRLAQLADEMPPGTLTSDRDNALVEALRPLRRVQHPEAAQVAEEIITSFDELLSRGRATQETIDTARGTLALVQGDATIASLLTELRASDAIRRERAARALRPVAFKRPDTVSADFADALRLEREPSVIVALLWAAYRVGPHAPQLLLDALSASPATQWTSPASVATAALTLFLLGSLAGAEPQRVVTMLPRHFDAYPPEQRALLAEALAYAWWRCSEHEDDARRHLTTLRHASLEDVPDDYRAFALRGAVMAQLGLMFPACGYADELHDKPTRLGGTSLSVFIVETNAFARTHADELAGHPDTSTLEELLLSCITVAHDTEVRVGFGPLRTPLFVCATNCLKMYARISARRPDPVDVLRALPQEWPALHATRQVLAEGHVDPPIIAYARTLCDLFMNGGSAPSAFERRQLLALLAAVDPAAPPNAQPVRRRMDVGGHGAGFEFASMVNSHPDEALHRLASAIREDNDLPILYWWFEDARTWATLLLSRVYVRMFDLRPIEVTEARELCTEVQAALMAFPDSPIQRDYALIYGAILTTLDGQRPGDIALLAVTDRIGQSHAYAAQLLHDGWSQDDGREWLLDTAADPRGVLESADYSASAGSLSSHFSRTPEYLYCPVPAVRLALVAVANHHGGTDPLATFMTERRTVDKLLSDLSWIQETVTSPIEQVPEVILNALDNAAERLKQQLEKTPRDERLWQEYGLLALKRNDLSTAEQSFARCLSLATKPQTLASIQMIRDSAIYNQACVFA